jgi:DNA-binding transcriptional LysR family regulator
MDFEKLRIFYLVCELKSFANVSKYTQIDQSTVGRKIKMLENILGQKLLEQTNKPIILTKAGEDLYAFAKEINSEFEHIERHVMKMQSSFENYGIKTYIGIPEELGYIMAKKMSFFLNELPEVFWDVSFIEKISFDLLNAKNMILSCSYYNHSLAENRKIGEFDVTFAASREYLKRRGVPTCFADLNRHSIITSIESPLHTYAATGRNGEVSLSKINHRVWLRYRYHT